MPFELVLAQLGLLEALLAEHPEVTQALDIDTAETCAALRYALSGLRKWGDLEEALEESLTTLSHALTTSKAP